VSSFIVSGTRSASDCSAGTGTSPRRFARHRDRLFEVDDSDDVVESPSITGKREKPVRRASSMTAVRCRRDRRSRPAGAAS
jgi:hypothetical protein